MAEGVNIFIQRPCGWLFHYAHFLWDCVVPEIHAKTYEKGFVVREASQNQTLGNFSPMYENIMGVENRELLKEECLKYPKLIVRSGVPTHKGSMSDEYYEKVLKAREFILPAASSDYPEKIIVRRGSSVLVEGYEDPAPNGLARRRINHFDQLDLGGYKVLVLEDMDFMEQVKHFQNARKIVGVHGAGLANLIFANEAEVIEVESGPPMSNWYPAVCDRLGLQHTRCKNNPGDLNRIL